MANWIESEKKKRSWSDLGCFPGTCLEDSEKLLKIIPILNSH